MRHVIIVMLMVTLSSCGNKSIDIILTENTLTLEGREVTLAELSDHLKSVTAAGDTPLVKLTIYEDAPMGDVNPIRKALREASFLHVRQFIK